MTDKTATWTFQEGHKRETRKSYQAYIEEISGSPSKEATPGTEPPSTDDMSDDSNIRRSKRTPIPKRNFKLIDEDFKKTPKEQKQPAKKKERKGRERKSVEKAPESARELKLEENLEETSTKTSTSTEIGQIDQNKESALVIAVKQEESLLPSQPEGPLPAQPEEPLCSKAEEPLPSKPEEPSPAQPEEPLPAQPEEPLPAQPEEPLPSKSEEPSSQLEDSQEESQPDEDDEGIAPRKSGRVRKPKEFKDSITPSYVKKSVERSKRTNPDEPEPPIEEAPKVADKKTSCKRKLSQASVEKKTVPLSVFDQEVAALLTGDQIKTEELTDSQNEESESGIPSKKSRRRLRVASTSAGEQSAEKSSPTKRKSKQIQQVATDTPVKSAGIKLKIKPMAERLSDEVSPTKKKQQDKKRKSGGGKLIVSFKKKASERKNNAAVTDEEKPAENEDGDIKPVISSLNVGVAPTTLGKSSKKKSPGQKKKKKKKKLDSKNQKVIEIKKFDEVQDKNIVKVKKKKIYKKRKGSKVLVRIIKNHCNVAGEVVKMETVAVDSVPVSDGESPSKEGNTVTSPSPLHAIDEEEDEDMDDEDDNDEDGEMTLIDQGIDPNDDEWQPGDDEEDHRGKSKKFKKNLDKTTKQQKQSAAGTKKAPSVNKVKRKGGQNVTIGGKVVGKTTKGLKRTGATTKSSATSSLLKPNKKPCPCCTGKLIRMSDNSSDIIYNSNNSEPKNAYNLFCRKYRPIIVQHHPRADFAEISRRLASIWKKASQEDRAGYFEVFSKMECAFRKKLEVLNRRSPSSWSEQEFEYIRKAISYDLPFQQPVYSETKLQPVDMAAHLQVLGESMNKMANTLQQQSSATVHGALSLMLDSMLCALGPLVYMTSFIPGLKGVDSEQMATTIDNIQYIMPGMD